VIQGGSNVFISVRWSVVHIDCLPEALALLRGSAFKGSPEIGQACLCGFLALIRVL
jgi:hypothetical protein